MVNEPARQTRFPRAHARFRPGHFNPFTTGLQNAERVSLIDQTRYGTAAVYYL